MNNLNLILNIPSFTIDKEILLLNDIIIFITKNIIILLSILNIFKWIYYYINFELTVKYKCKILIVALFYKLYKVFTYYLKY